MEGGVPPVIRSAQCEGFYHLIWLQADPALHCRFQGEIVCIGAGKTASSPSPAALASGGDASPESIRLAHQVIGYAKTLRAHPHAVRGCHTRPSGSACAPSAKWHVVDSARFPDANMGHKSVSEISSVGGAVDKHHSPR